MLLFKEMKYSIGQYLGKLKIDSNACSYFGVVIVVNGRI